jgi:hypothetical protein
VTDFNFIYHRRQTHVGLINGALWGAHARTAADNGVGNLTPNHRTIDGKEAAWPRWQ